MYVFLWKLPLSPFSGMRCKGTNAKNNQTVEFLGKGSTKDALEGNFDPDYE